MLFPFKRFLISALDKAGYTLLQKPDFEALRQEANDLKHETNKLRAINAQLIAKELTLAQTIENGSGAQDLELVVRCSRGSDEPLIPGIFFCSMPKSGTVFIAHALARGLRIELMEKPVSYGFFPNYHVVPRMIRHLSGGNKICQTHLNVNELNIYHLKAYLDRIVLHVRDPRQATLSWTHYYNRFAKGETEGPFYTANIPPKSYAQWTWDQQLDWQIETHLPSLVGWLNEWMDLQASDDNTLKILVTTYETFVDAPSDFYNKILNFYGIPANELTPFEPEKTADYNFRKGRPDEWRNAFTAEQKKRSAEIIGHDLLERFKWAPE